MPKLRMPLLAALFLGFLGWVAYSSLRLDQVAVEVSVEFDGRTNCGRAAAPTEEEAVRTAVDPEASGPARS